MGSLQGCSSSPTSTKDGGNFERPRRTSSMTINPSTVSVAQPPESPSQYVPDEQDQGLTRSTSTVALDGEPKLFPGIVSRNRRRSTRTSQVEDGEGIGVRAGFRKADTGSVVEERDTDDED
jgi:AMP deaminase